MLDYVYGHDQIVADFVAQLIPTVRERGFGNCKALGVIEGDSLVAGVVYHNWDVDAGVIELSGAALPGKQWLSRETIRRIYDYPFLQCGCQMIVKRVADDDARTLSQLARLNFMFVSVPRMLGRNKDGVIALLTSDDWVNGKIHRRIHRPEITLSEAA